jgi:hypothetical protein
MTTDPLTPGIGTIILGLLLVLALAAIIYMLGVWAVARMRQSRVAEETDTSYPATPQGADDRRAVEQIHARETNSTLPADNATDAALHEQAVGQGMRPVRQSPHHAERPVDAADRGGVAPTQGERDRNPL